MKNSNSKTNYDLSESLKGLNDSRYYVTGQKKYASRQEQLKEVTRVQEALSLIHYDNIGANRLLQQVVSAPSNTSSSAFSSTSSRKTRTN